MEKLPQMAPNRAGRIFVPTNPDLADILDRTDVIFENFYFFHFLDPTFLNFQVPKSQISGFPGPQISKIPDFQVPRFPDAADDGCGRILRSQPDPSPNAPRDQIRRKGPCCDECTYPNVRHAITRNKHNDWLYYSAHLKHLKPRCFEVLYAEVLPWSERPSQSAMLR